MNRNASATIKGFLFQFDATILSIIQLQDDESLTIEGIEDFDILHDDFTMQFQCKYLEATKLTLSTIREAILPMLSEFLRNNNQRHKHGRYHLYGYFKDSTPDQICLQLSELKKSLIIRKYKDGNKGSYDVVDLQTEMGATDKDLNDFLSEFTIHITEDYDSHKNKVVESLKNLFSVTLLESETYLYPTARTLISTIAIKETQQQRTLTKKEFLSQLAPSRALYNVWYLREKTENEYCSSMRNNYFCHRNIDNVSRIFIIDRMLIKSMEEILAICYELISKWCSHQVRRKPNNERYAPYLYLIDIPEQLLRELKQRLQEDNIKFVDGYSFLGAKFDFEHINIQQTYENKIALRIFSTSDEYLRVISQLRGRRIIYHFFIEKPIDIINGYSHISIPVTSTQMIKKIL